MKRDKRPGQGLAHLNNGARWAAMRHTMGTVSSSASGLLMTIVHIHLIQPIHSSLPPSRWLNRAGCNKHTSADTELHTSYKPHENILRLRRVVRRRRVIVNLENRQPRGTEETHCSHFASDSIELWDRDGVWDVGYHLEAATYAA